MNAKEAIEELTGDDRTMWEFYMPYKTCCAIDLAIRALSICDELGLLDGELNVHLMCGPPGKAEFAVGSFVVIDQTIGGNTEITMQEPVMADNIQQFMFELYVAYRFLKGRDLARE